MNFNVCSDGKGDWSFHLIDCILQRAFPNINITHNQSETPDLVIKSHFHSTETLSYSCPYICWSGESYTVPHKSEYEPIIEINSFYSDSKHSVYIPYLVFDHKSVARPIPMNYAKKYCCAFVYSNEVNLREKLFKTIRSLEPTSYSFGKRLKTNDNPFELSSNRAVNSTKFGDFGLYVAMENKSVPGYITEKIGFAYNSGTVPIYWGNSETVNRFFNPASFINVANYSSVENAANAAVNIWRDKQKYQKMLDSPIVVNGELADYQAVYTSYRPWQKPILEALYDYYPELLLGSSFWNTTF